jgi:phosphatidylglycerophosphate synthase
MNNFYIMDEKSYSLVEKLQSRKFLLTVTMLGLSSAFLGTGYANFGQWATFNQWLLGLYVSGNVGTALVHKLTQKDRSYRNIEDQMV